MKTRAAWTLTLMAGLALPAGAAARTPPPYCPVRIESPAWCDARGPAGSPFSAGANCRVVSVDGFPRQYVVYVPPGAPAGPRPVVFMHHGSSGSGYQTFHTSGWREKADEVGLVAVFPTSLTVYFVEQQRCTTKWHTYGFEQRIDPNVKPMLVDADGRPRQAYPAGAPWPADDVSFVRAMMQDLAGGLPVDQGRIYATGFSNGAGFSARLAVDLSEELAAAAWVGGGLAPSSLVGLPPVPARHIPVAGEVGNCDADVAEGYGLYFDPQACLRGQEEGLPLETAELMSLRGVVSRIHDHLDAFGLRHEPYSSMERPTHTTLSWSLPAQGPIGASPYHYTILHGVTHEYPVCNANRCNNPHQFDTADRFWEFFRSAGGS